MQTILFHDTIFGPIHSRRLGVSLGVNLMPRDGKICSFDCLYCEAGFNAQGPGKSGLPSPAEVAALIDAYRRIKPAEVMVYSIDRRTPAQNLRKVDADTLRAIAGRITAETGIPVQLTV